AFEEEDEEKDEVRVATYGSSPTAEELEKEELREENPSDQTAGLDGGIRMEDDEKDEEDEEDEGD
ncbi:hypothetical protein Dimus_010615, partial [Dionaea muscipula]